MNKKDNIHEAFSEQFDPQNIQNQGWNEPSDSVWEKISSDLDEKKKRIVFWPYILLLCLILAMICIGFLVSKNQKLTKEVIAIQTELDGYNQNSEAENNNNIFASSQSVASDLPSEEGNSSFSNYGHTQNKNVPFESSTTKSTSSSIVIPPTKDVAKIPQFLKENAFSQNYNSKETDSKPNSAVPQDELINSKIATPIKRDYPIITNIITLKGKVVRENPAKFNLYPSIIPTTADKKNKHSISLRSGVLASQLVNSGSQETALSELIDREYAKAGLNIDLVYSNAISSKLSVDMGIGISRQEFITEYDITLPYNTGQEIIENGIGRIDFEHSLPTSFGYTATELTLVRTRADVPLEESDVNIDFNTSHNLLTLRLPIGVNYHFLDNHEGFSLGLIAVPTYVIGAQSGISSVISKHSDISAENNLSVSEYKTLEKLNLAVGVNVGYSFPISDHGGLEFGMGYQTNVLSHFKTPNFSSRIQGMNLSAGYSYNF